MKRTLLVPAVVLAIGCAGCCSRPPKVDAPLVSYEQFVDQECVAIEDSLAPGTGIQNFWETPQKGRRRARTVVVEVTPDPTNRCRIEVYMQIQNEQLLVSAVTQKARARATLPAGEDATFNYYCVPLDPPPPDARCKGSIVVSVY